MKRTGWLESSDPMLNQLFSNILWTQKKQLPGYPDRLSPAG
jgi:hypothetical protein